MFIALAAAIALASQPATGADRFDLNCTGTTRTLSDPNSGVEPVELRISIDLKRRLYCYQEEGCETSGLAALTPATITLVDRSGELTLKTTIDRATRTYRSEAVQSAAAGGARILVEARCTALPFSPF